MICFCAVNWKIHLDKHDALFFQRLLLNKIFVAQYWNKDYHSIRASVLEIIEWILIINASKLNEY